MSKLSKCAAEAIASNQDRQPCRTFVGVLRQPVLVALSGANSHELSSRLQPSDERAQSIWAEYCEAAHALAALKGWCLSSLIHSFSHA